MEFQSELWFRVTQGALKVVPFVFGVLLLLPLCVLFWSMVWHRPPTPADRQAMLEKLAPLHLDGDSALAPEDDLVATGILIITEEKVGMGLNRLAGPWLTYYPRRWVGICGLAAAGVLLVLLGLSAFVPPEAKEQVSETWGTSDATAGPDK